MQLPACQAEAAADRRATGQMLLGALLQVAIRACWLEGRIVCPTGYPYLTASLLVWLQFSNGRISLFLPRLSAARIWPKITVLGHQITAGWGGPAAVKWPERTDRK